LNTFFFDISSMYQNRPRKNR